jgi:N-acetyltransferase 10
LQVSENFLQRMIALFVASHYKNTPNDLQLMSDAPAHQLFVLLGPIDVNATRLPEVLATVQAPLSSALLARNLFVAATHAVPQHIQTV